MQNRSDGHRMQVTEVKAGVSLQDRLKADMDSLATEVNQWGLINRGQEHDHPAIGADTQPPQLLR